MSRVHDMGGRFGDGRVMPEPFAPEPLTPVFHEDWHARALAVTLAAGALGQWNLDVSRHARERLSPSDYARFSYYEKWISALANLLVETGVVSRAELEGGEITSSDLAARAMRAKAVPDILAKGGPAARPSDVPQLYQPGDAVRTVRKSGNRHIAGGHTRLPVYAQNARGRVVAYHGTHIFPDSHTHGLGEAPEPLYAVAFPAQELWSAPEHPRDEVVLDLWQGYLEPTT